MHMKLTWLGSLTAALALATTATPSAAADLVDISGVYTGDFQNLGSFEAPAGRYNIIFDSSVPVWIHLDYTQALEQYWFADGVEVFHYSDAMDGSIPIFGNSFRVEVTGFSKTYNYFIYPTDYILSITRMFYGLKLNPFENPGAEGQTYHLRVAFIPEPQVWLMLIGGMFGTGALLRRRRARLEGPTS